MNKKIITITALSLAALLALSACKKEETPAETTAAAAETTAAAVETTETLPLRDYGKSETTAPTDETEETKAKEIVENDPNDAVGVEIVEDWEDDENVQPPVTVPAPTVAPETLPADPGSVELTYEQYLGLSAEDKQAYFESFENPEDFLLWYDAAMAEYEANRDVIDISGGTIDIGQLMGENK